MLIKALCDYADRLEETTYNKDKLPVGYSKQPISFEIILNAYGEITAIIDVRIPSKNDNGKPKGKPKIEYTPKEYTLPKRLETTKICSNIIEHRPTYIFGLNYDKGVFSPTDKTDKAKKSHEDFVQKNLKFFEGLTSDICVAYCNFIKNWIPENQTENRFLKELGKDYKNSYFIFGLDGYDGVYLHEDEQFKQRYQETLVTQCDDKSNDGNNLAMCGILGKNLPIARIHNKIKLPQGNSTGCVLVGMKEDAYQSYGKEQSYNSNISEDAMEKYTSTLNKLLANDGFGKKHHVVMDDMTIIYFAMKSDDTNECEMFYTSSFDEHKKDLPTLDSNEDLDNSKRQLNIIFNSLQDGKFVNLSKYNIDESITFYIIGLTPNSSRISQKFISRNKFGDVLYNMYQHRMDITISEHEMVKGISFGRIFRELVSPKSSTEKVSPPLKTAIILSALNGTRYPVELLGTIVRRIKTDSDSEENHFIKINDVRVGLIKGYLNRNSRLNGKKEEFDMSLDITNSNQAYNCGRAFAVLEKIQLDAQGDLNSTIKDRYFSSACSTPSTVFPTLIKLSNYHLSKLDTKNKSSKIYYQKKLAEIIDNLNGEFPSNLMLEEQGKFIIGYYHQNRELFTSNKKDNI